MSWRSSLFFGWFYNIYSMLWHVYHSTKWGEKWELSWDAAAFWRHSVQTCHVESDKPWKECVGSVASFQVLFFFPNICNTFKNNDFPALQGPPFSFVHKKQLKHTTVPRAFSFFFFRQQVFSCLLFSPLWIRWKSMCYSNKTQRHIEHELISHHQKL